MRCSFFIFYTVVHLFSISIASSASPIMCRDTVIIDSIYKPFTDIKKLSNMVRVNYRCWRNNNPLKDVFIVDLDSANSPAFCIRMGQDDKAGTSDANINLNERMNYVKIALQNISKDYGLMDLRQMFISASCFGEAFILINKEIDKTKVKSEAMISSEFKNRNNKIILGISKLLETHHLIVKDICIEEVLKYSRKEFLKYANFSGNTNKLPKVFYEPVVYEVIVCKE